MVPQLPSIALLIQTGNTHSVRVRLHMLGLNIHGHLAQVKIGADPCCGSDAGGLIHILDHGFCQLPGSHMVGI